MFLILSVDDNPGIQATIEETFDEREDIEIRCVENGRLGLEAIKTMKPNLVLLDYEMPVMDGPTMLRALREGGDKTPVVLLTGESAISSIRTMIQLGIESYVVKPFTPGILMEKVDKVMETLAPPPKKEEKKEPVAKNDEDGRELRDVFLIERSKRVRARFFEYCSPGMTHCFADSEEEAIELYKEYQFRLVVVDSRISSNFETFVKNMRKFQRDADFVQLVIGTLANQERAKGIDSTMVKPFTRADVDTVLGTYLNKDGNLSVSENVIRTGSPWSNESQKELGRSQGRIIRYFRRISRLILKEMEELAWEGEDHVIVDLLEVPFMRDRIIKLLHRFVEHAH